MGDDLPGISGDTRGVHDLGGGHYYRWLTGSAEYHPTDDSRLLDWRGTGSNLVGIIEGHRAPNGSVCEGLVLFVRAPGDRGPVWSVESLEPLTIDPSVHCVKEKGGCGAHGWIKQGRWTDA